jgi:hypothetical protein
MNTMMQEEPAAAGTGPLTLESALGLLSLDNSDAEDAVQPSTEQTKVSEDHECAGDCGAHGEAPDDTSVDAPASWKGSDQDLFRTLPQPLQARIAAREQERERAVNEALRESATHRKAAERGRAAHEAERAALHQQLNALVSGMQQQLAGEFGDIRTPADLVALAQKDPARYAVLRARQDALQHAQIEQQQSQAQMVEQQAAQLSSYAQREKAALLEKRPDLKDEGVRERFRRDLRDYAVSLGYAPEQVESNLSHVNLLVLEKAMLYDRAQRARNEAQVRSVPRVQRPGTAQTRGERASDHRAAKLKRLERSGRIEDAVGLLRI